MRDRRVFATVCRTRTASIASSGGGSARMVQRVAVLAIADGHASEAAGLLHDGAVQRGDIQRAAVAVRTAPRTRHAHVHVILTRVTAHRRFHHSVRGRSGLKRRYGIETMGNNMNVRLAGRNEWFYCALDRLHRLRRNEPYGTQAGRHPRAPEMEWWRNAWVNRASLAFP
jgi:hypothetical protein